MGSHGEVYSTGVTPTEDAETVDHSDLDSINWVPVQTVLPGIHRATVTNILLTLGAASGKPVLVWEFRLDGGQLIQLRTSKKGEGARKGYECTKALGVPRKFTRDEVVGRQCRVEVAIVGPWTDIVRVLPA